MLSQSCPATARPSIPLTGPVWAVVLLDKNDITEISARSEAFGPDGISDRTGHLVVLPAAIWVEEACRHVRKIGKRIFDFTAYNVQLPPLTPLQLVTAGTERSIWAFDLRANPEGVAYLRLADLTHPLTCQDVRPRYRQLD